MGVSKKVSSETTSFRAQQGDLLTRKSLLSKRRTKEKTTILTTKVTTFHLTFIKALSSLRISANLSPFTSRPRSSIIQMTRKRAKVMITRRSMQISTAVVATSSCPFNTEVVSKPVRALYLTTRSTLIVNHITPSSTPTTSRWPNRIFKSKTKRRKRSKDASERSRAVDKNRSNTS